MRGGLFVLMRRFLAAVRILSTFDLEKQIAADGPTWPDRRLLGSAASDLSPAGFGQQVSDAMERRRETLIDRGDALRRLLSMAKKLSAETSSGTDGEGR